MMFLLTSLYWIQSPAESELWGGSSGPAMPDEVSLQPDVVYARYGERKLSLDIYRSRNFPGPRPAILVIRGGGWLSTDHKWLGFVAGELAARGFVAASVEYRNSGEAQYPGAVDDVRTAVRWLRENARRLDITPGRLGAVGMSTGGYLALMLTRDAPGSRVQAVAALAPVSHLGLHVLRRNNAWRERHPGQTPFWNPVTSFMRVSPSDSPRVWIQASPAEGVEPESPALLLVQGTADPVVAQEQTFLMARRYRLAGNPVELKWIPGAPHAFWLRPSQWPAWIDQVSAFLTEHLVQP